jgi:hypothetical protein
MTGNLAVRFQDGVIGFASLVVLATAVAVLRAQVARIVPPKLVPARVRSSRTGRELPTGYTTNR